MEITTKIINNQINQLENEKLYKDIEYTSKKSKYNRRYYLKNRERLIKENVEHFKHYEKKEYYTGLTTKWIIILKMELLKMLTEMMH